MKKTSTSQLAIIFTLVFIDLVGFGMIIPLSSFLGKSLGASALQIGLLMSIYSAMQFLFSPVWGGLSDRYGRRPVLLFSLLLSGLCYLGYAYATELWQLFLWRALAGLFSANISTAMAYIADVSGSKDRSKSMGLIGAAFGLGFMFGPFLGGTLGSLGSSISPNVPFGMNFSALIASIICILNFSVAYFLLPESLPPEKRSKPQARQSRFKRIAENLRKPVVGPLMLVSFLSTFAMAHMESTVFYYVIEKFKWSLSFSSIGFAYVGLVMVITQGFLIRKLLPRFGEKNLLIFGPAMAAIGLLGIAYTSGQWSMLVTQTILALGLGLLNPSLLGTISLHTDEQTQGQVMGVNQSMSALGRILGPALGGIVYSQVGMYAPFFLASFFMIIALIISRSVSKNVEWKKAT